MPTLIWSKVKDGLDPSMKKKAYAFFEKLQESDELPATKVGAVYRHGLIPIRCFGDGPDVREAGDQAKHSVDRMPAAPAEITPEQATSIVLVYEPVWAIGTGRVATPADAQQVCGAARAVSVDKYGREITDGIRIADGGSVKAGNVAEITDQSDLDGALPAGRHWTAFELATLAANTVVHPPASVRTDHH